MKFDLTHIGDVDYEVGVAWAIYTYDDTTDRETWQFYGAYWCRRMARYFAKELDRKHKVIKVNISIDESMTKRR